MPARGDHKGRPYIKGESRSDLSMHSTLQFVLRHGYALVFLVVLTEQAGLPIPSLPVLLAAGALAGERKLSLPMALGRCSLADCRLHLVRTRPASWPLHSESALPYFSRARLLRAPH